MIPTHQFPFVHMMTALFSLFPFNSSSILLDRQYNVVIVDEVHERDMLTETWFWVKGSQNGCCRIARPQKQGHIKPY